MSTKNPFAKKGTRPRSPSKGRATLHLPNDEASLVQRSEKRKHFDLSVASLEVRNQTSTKPFERSYVKIIDQYPHHEILIKQLLCGAQLDLGSRIVSYQTHQDCYYAIDEFIACLNARGLQFTKQIRYLADIDYQTSKNFVAYLLREWPARTVNRKRYGRLKSVVQILQKRYEGDPNIGEVFTWATPPGNTDTPSESYPDHIFNQLVEASLTDVKFIMSLMKSYTATLANYKEKVQGVEFAVQRNTKLVGGTGSVIKGFSAEESLKYVSALTATTAPTWPLYCALADANDKFSYEWYTTVNHEADPNEKKIYRAISRMRITYSLKDQISGEVKPYELHVGQMAYFSQFFFTSRTLYPFLLLIQLNTGWNLEAVLSLSDDLDSHIGDDLIDPEQYALIYGSKWKTEDVLYCRSNKLHPYSVYNLLKFVQESIKPFKDSPYYQSGHLWQAIIFKNLWIKFGKIVMAFDATSCQSESVKFLQRHNIVLDVEAANPGIESKRIRTTWETKRKEQGLPVEVISPMMGHSDLDTTVINYDSDTGSTNLRNKKLRELQGGWDDDFRNYGVRLSTSTTLAELRASIKNGARKKVLTKAAEEIGCESEEAVIHLLAPEGQTYITACLNCENPTWPGAPRFVPKGSKCTFFNRCCMCNQAVIFKEALPYIARRISDLNSLRIRITSIEWASNYGDEASAWEAIFARWIPTAEVEEAKILSVNPEFALPLTLRGPQ